MSETNSEKLRLDIQSHLQRQRKGSLAVSFSGKLDEVYFSYVSGFIFRFCVVSFSSIPFFDCTTFFFYCTFVLFTAIVGDFFESFLKRAANVKDSSSLFPGHGGLLDRVDSLTLCIPVTYYFMTQFL